MFLMMLLWFQRVVRPTKRVSEIEMIERSLAPALIVDSESVTRSTILLSFSVALLYQTELPKTLLVLLPYTGTGS